MQKAIVNLNGKLFGGADLAAARVSVWDRSYLFGDSLYEVARTYGGKFFLMGEHLERLRQSAALCKMPLAQSTDDIAREAQKTLDAFLTQQPGEEAYCRLIVSRGEGRIGFGLENLTTSTLLTVIVQPLMPPSTEQFERGMKVGVVARLRNDRRALDPAMKSGNYLNSLLAYLEAREQDQDDALMIDGMGHLTEGTTYNIAYVRRGILATPPLDIGILAGITRRRVLLLAKELGIPTREVRFPVERLLEADEVMALSTIREVFPITSLNNRKIGSGKPGPLTRQLAQRFRQSVTLS